MKLLGLFLALATFALYQCDDDETMDVEVEGEYSWVLMFHMDNRGQDSEYTETTKYTKSITTSYSDMKDSIVKHSIKAGYSIKLDAVIEILNIGVSGSVDAEIDSSYQETITYKKDVVIEEELTRQFTVRAGSEMSVYQLVHRGPGVTVRTNTISTDQQEMDKVIIRCKVRKVKMLRAIGVQIGGNPPSDNPITEYHGGSTDTNSGQGGKYIYLTAMWTDSKNDALTGVQIVQQNGGCETGEDLAGGAGGKFRCLVYLHEVNTNTRISKIQLVRSPKDTYILPDITTKMGFDACSADINDGRGGDWLYLCWVNVHV